VVKVIIYIWMLFIFSMPVLFKHLWQLKTVVFLHKCLIYTVLLRALTCLGTLGSKVVKKNKRSSLLNPFESYDENKMLWIRLQKQEALAVFPRGAPRLLVRHLSPYRHLSDAVSIKRDFLTNWLLTKWQHLSCDIVNQMFGGQNIGNNIYN